MNDRDICRCHHQRGDHHPLLGLCGHATGTREACVCTAFVLVAGSTSTPKRTIADAVEELATVGTKPDADGWRLVPGGIAGPSVPEGFYVQLHTQDPRVGMDHVADLEARATAAARDRLDREYPSEDLAGRLARARRAAVLHPIAQASAAERCQIDDYDGTDSINVIGVDAIEVENIEWAPHPPCYGCGHAWDMHEEGTMGRGLACHDTIESFIAERDTQSVKQCPCPVYVGSPPPDACGRCGHAKNLHRLDIIPMVDGVYTQRCHGTGVDTDGNERARSCPCGRMGGYTPELPAEPGPLDELTRDPNCRCGHPESEHGLIDGGGHREVCRVRDEDGNLIDGCIEFRPATITHTLANGQVVSHTARDPR